MSNITIQLSDELVQQAKAVGVFNEAALAELCEQFLRTHIQLSQSKDTAIDKQNGHTQASSSAKQINQSIANMFSNWDV